MKYKAYLEKHSKKIEREKMLMVAVPIMRQSGWEFVMRGHGADGFWIDPRTGQAHDTEMAYHLYIRRKQRANSNNYQ